MHIAVTQEYFDEFCFNGYFHRSSVPNVSVGRATPRFDVNAYIISMELCLEIKCHIWSFETLILNNANKYDLSIAYAVDWISK